MAVAVAMMPVPTVGEGRHKKKRLSFGWTLKKGEEQHPISALEENDDEAERRQRRKTHTRNSFVGDQDSSLNASILSPESNPSTSGRRASMKLSEQPLSLKGKTALSSAQLIDLYSRCIQLSTENKINRENSWKLNLIDYMDDVLHSHHQEGDLTNFQAASCTLEASTKIYSCRVDSVHEDTFKILGGLTRTEKGASSEEDLLKVDEGESKEEGKKPKARKHIGGINTLEANPESLDVKKFDLEFDVDPLFRKTSAAFDEGGARGLLLNHLSVGYGGDIIFDSADAVNAVSTASTAANLLCDLTDFQEMLQEIESTIAHLEICPPFSDFHFGNSKTLPESKGKDQGKEEVDFFDHNMNDDDDDDVGGFDADQQEENMLEEIRESVSLEDENGENDTEGFRADFRGKAPGAKVDISRRQVFPDVEYCLAMAEADDANVDMNKLLQNWAGPEHWKFTSATYKADKQTSSKEETENKKTKAKKKTFLIDFFAADIDYEKAFAGPGRASTTLSSASIEKATGAATTLPADIHYDISELSKLFLKPNWAIRLPGSRPTKTRKDGANEFLSGVVEEPNFIHGDANSDDDDESPEGGVLYGSPGFAFGGSCFDGEALVAEPKKVEKISINYAKVAKKVDVKALKANLWNELCGVSDNSKPSAKSEEDIDHKSFADVLESLPNRIPEQTLTDISVPFCFICLLHLANEKGLTLTQDTMSELYVSKAD